MRKAFTREGGYLENRFCKHSLIEKKQQYNYVTLRK